MIVYHGTTRHRAERICRDGFQPRRPSRRVWFAVSKAYADGRARTQARRSHDRAVVLTCDIDLGRLRERYGTKRVISRNSVIAIDGPVPVSVLRSHPFAGVPTSPRELSRWVNSLLGVKNHKGVPSTHPGIQRLARWVVRRTASEPRRAIKPQELLDLARQWLGEFFVDYEVDVSRLKAYPRTGEIELALEHDLLALDPLEAQAIEYLDSDKAARRARGLKLLARIEDPDLFDWCAMFLEDPSVQVVVAALRAMRHSRPDDPDIIEPLTASPHKQVRAAAIAALAKHGGKDSTRWYERGLKDPEPCIRLETARILKHLDPKEHRGIFELARYDPNPEIEKLARKLTQHQGYTDESRRTRIVQR